MGTLDNWGVQMITVQICKGPLLKYEKIIYPFYCLQTQSEQIRARMPSWDLQALGWIFSSVCSGQQEGSRPRPGYVFNQ